jgi:cytochrome c-type biogenesis protein CcmH/NrfG
MFKPLHAGSYCRYLLLPLFLALLTPLFSIARGGSGLEAAWKSFYANDRQQARELFSKATKDAATKAEAHLGLSLLATINKPNVEAFAEYARFATANPDHYPYTFALWGTESVTAGSGKKSAAQLAYLQNLSKDERANGTLRAMAQSIIGSHYEATNNGKLAETAYSQIGAITDWQIVGEFENISASGFNKAYGPIKNAAKDATFVNKAGAKVKWFNLPAFRADRWIDFTYHFYTHNSVIYAQTFVNSPVEQEVQLRLGVSGSLKAWVNDKLVLAEQEERNNDLDTYLNTVKLKKGYNRLLVQVAESYADRSNFMARLTDETGKPISGLTYSKEPQPYTAETSYETKVIPVFAESYFEGLIKKEPAKVLNHILLGHVYLRSQKVYEARKAFMAAQKLAPESSYIMSLLIQLYQQEGNRTQLATALEWLKDNDPENPLSLNLLYNDEVEKENYDNAAAILTKIEKASGKDENVYLKSLQLAYLNKKEADMVKISEEAYSKFPEHADFVRLKYLVEKTVRKNSKASLNVLKEFLKSNNHYSHSELLASDYFEKGAVADGLKIYQSAIASSPEAVGYQYKLGTIYANLQDFKKAEETYRKTLTISPYVGMYWAELAKTQNVLGNKTDAIASYKKAIEFEPTDFNSIKELRKLESKKDVFEYFPAVDVYALAKAAPSAAAYPEDRVLIVYDEVQRVVYKSGASEEKRIFVLKVLDEKGVDDWKEYSIGYNSDQRMVVEKAEVIKQNGTKVPAETNNNQLVFTNLEAGDAIHYTYKLENYNKGRLASHFWDRYYFTHFLPYLTTKYSLLISPEVKFQHKVTQQPLKPVVTKPDADFDLYVWSKEKQEALKYEDKMPAMADVGQALHLTSIPDWNYVSNWYSDLASEKAKADFEVKEVVADLFKDKAHFTAEAKVKAIYDYIISNIKYSSVSFRQSGLIPQKASTVLNTRIGDCKDVSTLFVAMCKEVGIDASLVLVNTRENGLYDLELPSIEFNHCIAKVDLNGKSHYLELTSNFLPFGSLYSSMLNSRILEIKDEKNTQPIKLDYLNPTVRKPNNVVRQTNIRIKDKSLEISESNFNTASMAASNKSRYRHLSSKERDKQILEALKSYHTNSTLGKLEFFGLEGTADTVRSNIDYTLQGVITQVGGMSLFSLPWSSKATASDFVVNEERHFPIDLSKVKYADMDKETITVVIPANKALVEVPKTVSFSCANAEYTLSCKLVNKTLQFTRELKYKGDIIPADKVQEFSDFYKKVIEADARQIAFK